MSDEIKKIEGTSVNINSVYDYKKYIENLPKDDKIDGFDEEIVEVLTDDEKVVDSTGSYEADQEMKKAGYKINEIENNDIDKDDDAIEDVAGFTIENIDDSDLSDLCDKVLAQDQDGEIGDGNMQCVSVVKAQLISKGLVDADNYNTFKLGNGNVAAITIIENPDLINGEVTSLDYDQFKEGILNGNSYDNIVISFSDTGTFRNTNGYGHVVMISEIKDGNVYLIDNYGEGYAKGVTARIMPVDKFCDEYFDPRNVITGIADIDA